MDVRFDRPKRRKLEYVEELGPLLFAAFGLVALAGLSHFIRNSTTNGTLSRNSAIGLKTKVTKSSDIAWSSGHDAAGPWLLTCAWTGYFMGAATAAGAFVAMAGGSIHPALWIFPTAGFVAVVVLLILATVIANKYGRHAVK